jgi:hypothetical protein
MRFKELYEKYILSDKLKSVFNDRRPLDVEEDVDVDVDVDVEDDSLVFKGRRTEKLNIGKGLSKRLYPDLSDAELADSIKKLRMLGSVGGEYSIKIRDDVSDAYESYGDTPLESCVNAHPNVVPFYDTQKGSLEMIELFKHGGRIGRALLWSNVDGAGGKKYMDRTYPSGNEEAAKVLRQFAVRNG